MELEKQFEDDTFFSVKEGTPREVAAVKGFLEGGTSGTAKAGRLLEAYDTNDNVRNLFDRAAESVRESPLPVGDRGVQVVDMEVTPDDRGKRRLSATYEKSEGDTQVQVDSGLGRLPHATLEGDDPAGMARVLADTVNTVREHSGSYSEGSTDPETYAAVESDSQLERPQVEAFARLSAQGYDVRFKNHIQWNTEYDFLSTSNGSPVARVYLRTGEQLDPDAPVMNPKLRLTHNLDPRAFATGMETGGLPSPSISVAAEHQPNVFNVDTSTPSESHVMSLVLKPTAVKWGHDPVFNDDGYTPTFPWEAVQEGRTEYTEDERLSTRWLIGHALKDAVAADELNTALDGLKLETDNLRDPASVMRVVEQRLDRTSLLEGARSIVKREVQEFLDRMDPLSEEGSVQLGDTTLPLTNDNIVLAMYADDLPPSVNADIAEDPARALESLQANPFTLTGENVPDSRLMIHDFLKGYDPVNDNAAMKGKVTSEEEARRAVMAPRVEAYHKLTEAKPIRTVPMSEVQRVVVPSEIMARVESPNLEMMNANTREAIREEKLASLSGEDRRLAAALQLARDMGIEVVEMTDDVDTEAAIARLQSPEASLFSIKDQATVHAKVVQHAGQAAEQLTVTVTDSTGTWQGGIDGLVSPGRKTVRIRESHLNSGLRGKGTGLAMYNLALKEAADRGFTLESDSVVSTDAQRVYDALRRRGVRVYRNPDAVMAEKGHLVATPGDPVFTVHPEPGTRLSVQDLEDGFDPAATPDENHHGMVADAVGKAAEKIVAAGNLKGVDVVRTVDELPDAVREDMRQAGVTAINGAYRDGRVYLVSSELESVARAEEVLVHEAVAHGGLRAVFGTKLNGVLRQVWDARSDDIRTWLDQSGYQHLNTEGKLRDRMVATEEYIAHVAEDTTRDETTWERIVGAVRRMFNRIGLGHWSDGMIRDMVRNVRRAVETPGVERVAPGDAAMFSVSGRPPKGTPAQEQETAEHMRTQAVGQMRAKGGRVWDAPAQPGALDRIEGVQAHRVHRLKPDNRATLARNNMWQGEMLELPMTEDAARLFHARLTDGSGGRVPPASELARSRMFISRDGSKGFAITPEGEGRHLFNTRPDDNYTTGAMAALAVDEGMVKVEVPDGRQAELYRPHGFEPVARVASGTEGTPDTVFMALGNRFGGRYDGGGGVVGTPEEARAAQHAFRARVEAEQPGPQTLEDVVSMPDDRAEAVAADPNSNLSVFRRLAGKFAADGEGRGTRVRDILRETALDGTRMKTVLSMVTTRGLRDFLPQEKAPALSEYVKSMDMQNGRRNTLQSRYEGVAKEWRNWSMRHKREAAVLADVMHLSTVAGLDPTQAYSTPKSIGMMDLAGATDADNRMMKQHARLEAMFKTLSPEGQKLYAMVRDSYAEMRDSMQAALLRRIEASGEQSAQRLSDELRKQFEDNRVEGPYFPLLRYGEYWASAKRDGNVVAFTRFETKRERDKWANDFKAEGYDIDRGLMVDQPYEMSQAVSPEFARDVMSLTEDEDIRAEIWQTYLKTLPEMSLRKHALRRKGRLGYSLDALRNYAHFSTHSATQQARLEHGTEMNTALRRFHDEMRVIENDPDTHGNDAAWAPHVYQNLLDRHRASQNPNTHPASIFATSVGFDLFLSASAGAAAVNMSQVPLVTFPFMAARYGGIRASRELVAAARDTVSAINPSTPGVAGVVKKLRKGGETSLASAIEREYDAGLFGRTQAFELAGLGEASIVSSQSAYGRAHRTAAFLFHTAEVANRVGTFIAAHRLAEKAGSKDPEADATEMTWDTHFDYGQENRPTWMRGNLIRVLTLFKVYSLNMSYTLGRAANDALRHETPEVRSEARKRLGGLLGMGMMATGFTGLPAAMTWPVMAMLETMFDEEDEPFDAQDALWQTLNETMGQTAARAVMYGAVDTFTPMSVADRLSYSNLWFQDPYPLHEDEQAFLRMATGMLGPLPSFASNLAIRAPEAIKNEQYHRAVEYMLPKGMADMVKAHRYLLEGETTQATPPLTVVPPEEFTTGELAAQALGFRPSGVAWQKRNNLVAKKKLKALADRKADIMTRLSLAHHYGDEAGMAQAIEDVKRWNTKNRLDPIVNPSASLRQKAIDQATNIRGIVPTKYARSYVESMDL